MRNSGPKTEPCGTLERMLWNKQNYQGKYIEAAKSRARSTSWIAKYYNTKINRVKGSTENMQNYNGSSFWIMVYLKVTDYFDMSCLCTVVRYEINMERIAYSVDGKIIIQLFINNFSLLRKEKFESGM